MQVKTYTATKIVLSPEEKEIKKSWSIHWSYFRKKFDRHEKFIILFGEWSGYNSKQQRIVHIDIGSEELFKKSESVGTIEYSDGTTLKVWQEKIGLTELFDRKLKCNPTYKGLVTKLMLSGSSYYKV